MKSIYLGGPIAGLSLIEAEDRRREAADALRNAGMVPVNPMRDVVRFNRVIGGHPPDTVFVSRDLRDIAKCDALLMDFRNCGDRVSIGTCVEIGVAFTLRKPIVALVDVDNPHDHPFIREMAQVMSRKLHHAVEALRFILA